MERNNLQNDSYTDGLERLKKQLAQMREHLDAHALDQEENFELRLSLEELAACVKEADNQCRELDNLALLLEDWDGDSVDETQKKRFREILQKKAEQLQELDKILLGTLRGLMLSAGLEDMWNGLFESGRGVRKELAGMAELLRKLEKGESVSASAASEPPQPVAPPQPSKPVSGPIFCRRCGYRVTTGSRFCVSCGSLLGDTGAVNGRGQVVSPPPMPSMPSAPPLMPSMPAPSAQAAPAPGRIPPPPMPSMSAAPAPSPSMAPSLGAPQKPSKQGLFSRLFKGGDEKRASKEKPSESGAAPAGPAPSDLQADDVQFRGSAPASIKPGNYFTVKIMMYREQDYERADRESAALGDKVKSASSSVLQAYRNQAFRICLQSPDIELEEDWAELRWNGKYAAADFEVLLPEDYDKRQLRIQGRVYSGIAVLTDLKMILEVDSPREQTVQCEKTALRTAFISYASADREKVVARIQGIQLACPDIDLFFDAESLRRGEQWEPRLYREIEGRDLFYLFWSRNAARSEWVAKELGYAVAKKTTAYIEPVPLESPDICPPPEVLSDKHFNDWTLRYLTSREQK